MIKLEKTEVVGLEAAIRGMRNPMNSWDRSDSGIMGDPFGEHGGESYSIGPNDHNLMMRLAKAGSVHGKFRRMIAVYVDITAPLYWWKEFDAYKVGTVANSCSTMHKIHAKEFTLDDFSHEHLFDSANGDDTDCYIDIPDDNSYFEPIDILKLIVDTLNQARILYLDYQKKASNGNQFAKKHVKEYWWQMIQLLPSSYNQKKTIMMNYEVLANIYQYRRDHKLDEWRDLCKWIEELPGSEIITG